MSASASASASALPSLASRPTFQPSPAPTSPPPPAHTQSFSRADRDRSNRSNRSHPFNPSDPTLESPGTYPPLPSSPPLGSGASASRQLSPKHRDDGVSLSDFLSSPPGDREVAASTHFGPSMPHGRSPFDTGSGSSANYDYSYNYGHGSGSGWGSSTSAGGSNPRPRAGAGNSEPAHKGNATNGHISGVGMEAQAHDQDQDQDQDQNQAEGHGHGHGPGAVSVAGPTDWEAAFEARRREEWERKVQEDLRGWRGGNGPARSAYSRTALPGRSYFNQLVTGRIGAHLPKEIVRIERDWSGGEVCQFETGFPMELEGRITPTQFHTFVTSLNAHLSSAYSLRGAAWDNLLAIASWWTSLWWHTSHFEKELQNAEALIAKTNREVFNPKGLNALSPRDVALQFLEIEYY